MCDKEASNVSGMMGSKCFCLVCMRDWPFRSGTSNPLAILVDVDWKHSNVRCLL